MSWAAVITAGGTIAGGLISKSGSKSSGPQSQLDPRAQSLLYGEGADPGLLAQYKDILNKPQDAALDAYGKNNLSYLGNAGADQQLQHTAAAGLIGDGTQGRINTQSYAVGNQVQAPGQNGMDLSGSYDKFINGTPGANPYLTGAIQKGINQSSNAFGNMVSDAKNATNDVLGGIRGNSVLTGQYGGSRQGVAEGKAIESMNTQLGRAASQFGQNNTDAAVAAQAGAYDTDQGRALAATQGLGAQQYNVAQQNANTKNQAEFMNINNALDTAKANQGAVIAGIGATSGLLGNAYNVGQNQDQYSTNQAIKGNGLLQPYLGTPGAAPQYQNTAGNILGGATAGAALGSKLGNWFSGGSGPGTGSYGGGGAGTYYDGYSYMPAGK